MGGKGMESMFSTTLMIAAEHGSGGQGRGIYYAEESKKVVGPENPWAEATIGEQYTEVTEYLDIN